MDFKDEKGRRYHKTAVVKGKNGETEELPLYTDHDAIYGEVNGRQHSCTTVQSVAATHQSVPNTRVSIATAECVETLYEITAGAHHSLDNQTCGAQRHQGAADRPDRAGLRARLTTRLCQPR